MTIGGRFERLDGRGLLLFFSVLVLLIFQLGGAVCYGEDLVLSGTDEMVIESTTYTQTGNIIIQDNAKLTVKNATLVLNVSYHEEFTIRASGHGTLDVVSSVLKTSSSGENVLIHMLEESALNLQDSAGQVVGVVFGEEVTGDPGRDVGFHGTASITGSALGGMGMVLTPYGGATISVTDTAINELAFESNNGYKGEFSDLKPGLFGSWTYSENGYKITLTNTTVNNIDVCPMGPSQVVVRNSEIFSFFLQAALPTISMQAIDSIITNTGFFLGTKASFWDLKPGFKENWKLSEHSVGESLPEMIFTNTEITYAWSVQGCCGAELNVDNSVISDLRLYFNSVNITVTNSTVSDRFMFYNATNSTVHFDNTAVKFFDVYVPPNSVTLTGNITFPATAELTHWLSPSTVTRSFPVVVRDSVGAALSGVEVKVYDKGEALVWTGTTDGEGKAEFSIDFTDTNHSALWRMEASYLGRLIGAKSVGLLTSTPISVQYFAGVTLVTPNGGEVLQSGGSARLAWGGPQEAAWYKLFYSLDNGLTWTTIVRDTGTSRTWTVPVVRKNIPSGRVRVAGYNSKGKKIGADKSDKAFTIEVTRLAYPNGGESLVSGSDITVTWAAYATVNPVARAELSYSLDKGVTWKKFASQPSGNPGSYRVTLPTVGKARPKCLVRVILRDGSGRKVGSDTSNGVFTVSP